MSQGKNQSFKKYGHDCELNDNDIVEDQFPGNDCLSTICRILMRATMLDEDNPRCRLFLRSHESRNREKINHLKNNSWMIHPFSKFRVVWECIYCVSVLASLIVIPVDFYLIDLFRTDQSKNTDDNDILEIIKGTAGVIVFIDIALTFLTGYHTINNIIIMNPKKVAIHYLSRLFVLDLISSLPFEAIKAFHIASSESIIYAAITIPFILLRLYRLYHIQRYYFQLTEVFEMGYKFTSLTILIVYVVTIVHWAACLQVTSYGGWQKGSMFSTISTRSTKDKYIMCLFRMVSIMTSTGFGGYSPVTNVDKFVVIACALGGKLLTIYITAKLYQIVVGSNSAKTKYGVITEELQQYNKFRKLPNRVSNKVLNYYNYRFNGAYFQETQIHLVISSQLRDDMRMHHCRRLVEDVIFFKNFPLGLLSRIISCLHKEIFLTNELIMRADTNGDCMYFILSGTVAVYSSSGKEICHLQDGSHFGEIALVMPEELRIATVIAAESSELYRLTREDFTDAIVPFPDLFLNIQNIAADRSEKTKAMAMKVDRALYNRQRFVSNQQRPKNTHASKDHRRSTLYTAEHKWNRTR